MFATFSSWYEKTAHSWFIALTRTSRLPRLCPKTTVILGLEKYKGFEYIRSGHEYVAKTGNCTYCGANSEDDIERTLKRLDRKESPDLDKNLQRAMETVAGNDYYAAGHLAELGGVIEKARWPGEMSRYFPVGCRPWARTICSV